LRSQAPLASHVNPDPHVPQFPPQPSPPHDLPLHDGTQAETHWLFGLQVRPPLHVPQVPPQPSLPHCLSAQLGRQEATHWLLALHVCEEPHVPHVPPQPSLPQVLPLQAGVHEGAEQETAGPHGCPEYCAPLFLSGSAFWFQYAAVYWAPLNETTFPPV